LVNESGLIVPFTIPISFKVNNPSLMVLLKLNVILLAAVLIPPLPVIVMVGTDVVVLVVGMIYSPLLV
jgi:hypothetical protein